MLAEVFRDERGRVLASLVGFLGDFRQGRGRRAGGVRDRRAALVVQPDVLIRTPLPIETTGVRAMKEVFERLRRAFPDLHIAVEDVIAEGDKVVYRNTVTGTHLGEYMGLPPTGRSVTYDEIFVIRVADGRIAETWGSSTSSRSCASSAWFPRSW